MAERYLVSSSHNNVTSDRLKNKGFYAFQQFKVFRPQRDKLSVSSPNTVMSIMHVRLLKDTHGHGKNDPAQIISHFSLSALDIGSLSETNLKL